jgi:hypothetical protein
MSIVEDDLWRMRGRQTTIICKVQQCSERSVNTIGVRPRPKRLAIVVSCIQVAVAKVASPRGVNHIITMMTTKTTAARLISRLYFQYLQHQQRIHQQRRIQLLLNQRQIQLLLNQRQIKLRLHQGLGRHLHSQECQL